MWTRARLLPALALAAAVVLAGCGGPPATEGARPEGPGARGPETAVPELSFETFEGDKFSLAEQRGTPVVLNFWESW